MLTKDAELQMELRGIISNKKQLITALEDTYTKANSETDFYKKLQQKGIELYSRNDKIVGAKLNRKFRFKTLGYDKTILQELDKNLTQNKRLSILKSIRERQDKQQGKDIGKGRKKGRFPL